MAAALGPELAFMALEELALDGYLAVPALWARLAVRLRSDLGMGEGLSDEAKQAVWAELTTRRAEDVQVVTEGEAVPAPPEPDFRSAEANQRKLVASRALRNAVVAACAGRSVDMVVDLNDKEEKVVFEVARKRYDGALQTDMAKLIGVTPANFFNIAKALEARGLLVRTKARAEFASAGAGAGHLRSRTGLHIVAHLKRFAPSSGNTQALSQTDAWESVEMEDDTTLVLKALGAANGNVALESELKKELGFEDRQGHRRWRRVRDNLIKSKHVVVENAAKGEDTSVPFLRLVKRSDALPLPPLAELLPPVNAATLPAPSLAMMPTLEVPMNRMVVDAVESTGTAGIMSHKLLRALQLENKINYPRLTGLVQIGALRARCETQGRVVAYRLWGPQHYQTATAASLPAAGTSAPPPLLALPAPSAVAAAAAAAAGVAPPAAIPDPSNAMAIVPTNSSPVRAGYFVFGSEELRWQLVSSFATEAERKRHENTVPKKNPAEMAMRNVVLERYMAERGGMFPYIALGEVWQLTERGKLGGSPLDDEPADIVKTVDKKVGMRWLRYAEAKDIAYILKITGRSGKHNNVVDALISRAHKETLEAGGDAAGVVARKALEDYDAYVLRRNFTVYDRKRKQKQMGALNSKITSEQIAGSLADVHRHIALDKRHTQTPRVSVQGMPLVRKVRLTKENRRRSLGQVARCRELHRFLVSKSAEMRSFDEPLLVAQLLAVIPLNSMLKWLLYEVSIDGERPTWFATAIEQNAAYGSLDADQRARLWCRPNDGLVVQELMELLTVLKKLGLIKQTINRELDDENRHLRHSEQHDVRQFQLFRSAHLERPALSSAGSGDAAMLSAEVAVAAEAAAADAVAAAAHAAAIVAGTSGPTMDPRGTARYEHTFARAAEAGESTAVDLANVDGYWAHLEAAFAGENQARKKKLEVVPYVDRLSKCHPATKCPKIMDTYGWNSCSALSQQDVADNVLAKLIALQVFEPSTEVLYATDAGQQARPTYLGQDVCALATSLGVDIISVKRGIVAAWRDGNYAEDGIFQLRKPMERRARAGPRAPSAKRARRSGAGMPPPPPPLPRPKRRAAGRARVPLPPPPPPPVRSGAGHAAAYLKKKSRFEQRRRARPSAAGAGGYVDDDDDDDDAMDMAPPFPPPPASSQAPAVPTATEWVAKPSEAQVALEAAIAIAALKCDATSTSPAALETGLVEATRGMQRVKADRSSHTSLHEAVCKAAMRAGLVLQALASPEESLDPEKSPLGDDEAHAMEAAFGAAAMGAASASLAAHALDASKAFRDGVREAYGTEEGDSAVAPSWYVYAHHASDHLASSDGRYAVGAVPSAGEVLALAHACAGGYARVDVQTDALLDDEEDEELECTPVDAEEEALLGLSAQRLVTNTGAAGGGGSVPDLRRFVPAAPCAFPTTDAARASAAVACGGVSPEVFATLAEAGDDGVVAATAGDAAALDAVAQRGLAVRVYAGPDVRYVGREHAGALVVGEGAVLDPWVRMDGTLREDFAAALVRRVMQEMVRVPFVDEACMAAHLVEDGVLDAAAAHGLVDVLVDRGTLRREVSAVSLESPLAVPAAGEPAGALVAERRWLALPTPMLI